MKCKGNFRLAAMLCSLLSFGIGYAHSEESASREYKIKAAYLYNLIKFVDWPQSARQQMVDTGHTTICIVGTNPFANHLDKLKNRQAKGLAIDVQYLANSDTLSPCHIAFVAGDKELANREPSPRPPLLTVGEHSDFVTRGGIVALVVRNNNVRLQINLDQAREQGFEISGNLLEIAEIIQ